MYICNSIWIRLSSSAIIHYNRKPQKIVLPRPYGIPKWDEIHGVEYWQEINHYNKKKKKSFSERAIIFRRKPSQSRELYENSKLPSRVDKRPINFDRKIAIPICHSYECNPIIKQANQRDPLFFFYLQIL